MPEISRFLGIVIRMYLREHYPAHFHAEYGEYEITIDIETGVVIGKFPKRALRIVLEWYDLHRDVLGFPATHLCRLEVPYACLSRIKQYHGSPASLSFHAG